MPKKKDIVIKEEKRIFMEQWYQDGSGVEYGVRLDREFKSDEFLSVIFTHIDDVAFPVEKIAWLKECLDRIESELNR